MNKEKQNCLNLQGYQLQDWKQKKTLPDSTIQFNESWPSSITHLKEKQLTWKYIYIKGTGMETEWFQKDKINVLQTQRTKKW